LTRSQFRPGNVAFAPVSRPVLASRFYATEPESKDAQGETATAEANGNGAEAEAEDPLKKELEAKNKEIIDLKVCCPHCTSRGTVAV
jgi:molecular chaperone GrpE